MFLYSPSRSCRFQVIWFCVAICLLFLSQWSLWPLHERFRGLKTTQQQARWCWIEDIRRLMIQEAKYFEMSQKFSCVVISEELSLFLYLWTGHSVCRLISMNFFRARKCSALPEIQSCWAFEIQWTGRPNLIGDEVLRQLKIENKKCFNEFSHKNHQTRWENKN